MKKIVPSKLLILFLIFGTQVLSSAQEVLYFCSNVTGRYQAYKKDLTSGAIEMISNNGAFNYWWVEPSPDHTELLMMRSPVGPGIDDQFDYDNCQMIKSTITGNNETVIVDTNQNGWIAFGNPHWHPDGNRIIMLAQPTNEFFLFTIDVNGNNPIQLTNQFSLDPHWSPDGNKIVFIGINSTPTFPASFDDFEVFTADYNFAANALSNILQLTDDTFRDQDPCFSPDQSAIAFSSGSDNLSFANITRIDTDGNNRTQLVGDNTTNGGPVNWGTNNKIYYHQVNLFVTNFTAKEYEVSTNTNTDLFPSPASGYISPFYSDLNLTAISPSVSLHSNLAIYPNPIHRPRLLTVAFENEIDPGEAKIFNLWGRVVYEKRIYNTINTFDLSDLNSGVYWLQLNLNQKKFLRKIVIN